MKVGFVAPEFPPAVGGMEDHAAGLADAFALDNDVVVFTKQEYASIEYDGRFDVSPILTGRLSLDTQKLAHERMDRWLTLNAAYSWLSRRVDAPVFSYCHGHDFLKPWTDMLTTPERAFVKVLGGLPYFWRFRVPIERKLKQLRIAQGLAGARMIFVNSRNTQEILSATFPSVETPIVVSWPGVSEVFFEGCRSTAPFPAGSLRLVTIARLCRNKNVGNVLRALAMLKGEVDFSYTVVGDGDLRPELERLAADLELGPKVRFLGRLPTSEAIANLDASDLFVLPSLFEGFGIVYSEAAARGLPSLASRTGGAVDAVVENVNGILVDGPEPEQIAEGVRRFSRMQPRPDRDEIRRFASQFRRSVVADQMKKAVLGPSSPPVPQGADNF
jgi:glycosyltransferase involved in cell wall biosynthesis